jgi:hypothetical protein
MEWHISRHKAYQNNMAAIHQWQKMAAICHLHECGGDNKGISGL